MSRLQETKSFAYEKEHKQVATKNLREMGKTTSCRTENILDGAILCLLDSQAVRFAPTMKTPREAIAALKVAIVSVGFGETVVGFYEVAYASFRTCVYCSGYQVTIDAIYSTTNSLRQSRYAVSCTLLLALYLLYWIHRFLSFGILVS